MEAPAVSIALKLNSVAAYLVLAFLAAIVLRLL